MGYLILQILWFLVAAALAGFVVGWLCRSVARERKREASASRSGRRLDDVEAERDRLQTQLAEAATVRKTLQDELAQAHQKAEASAKSMRKLERDHASAQIKLEARERDLARLGAELDARHSDSRPAGPAPAVAPHAYAPLEPAAEEPGTPPVPLAAPQGAADDLQRIRGVGPGTEKTLNELGIFHYRQIAELSPQNLVWIDRRLRFKGQIEREDWVGQAKALMADALAAIEPPEQDRGS